MSTNLNGQSDASTIDSAAIGSGQSPDTSAANAADKSADRADDTIAASGTDAREAQLDKEYDERNLLAPEDQESAPEKLEPESEPEKVEPPPKLEAEPEEIADDPFAEEQTKPRTLEDINKQYSRAPIPVREDLARVEAEKWALREAVNKIGGEVGIEVAQTLMPALLSHNPSEQDASEFLSNIAEVNPGLLVAGSRALLDQSLTDERPDPATGTPINIATGNYLVKQYLSEKLDLETVEKLVQYEEAGLIDHEDMAERLELGSEKSEREKALEARLSAIEGDKKKESQVAEQKAEAQVQQRLSHATGFVSKHVMGTLIPVAEHYGWTATKEELASDKPEVKETAEFKVALGELITPWMEAYKQNLPEWSALEHLAKEGLAFNQDGKPTAIFKKNLEHMDGKVLAAFKAKVRVMNKTLGKSFGSTRAAQLQAKTTRSGAATTPVTPSVRQPNANPPSADDKIAALDRQFDEAVRENRASL